MKNELKLVVEAGTLWQRFECEFDEKNVSVVYTSLLTGPGIVLLAISLLIRMGFLTLEH